MKISELIKELQENLEELGDVDVKIINDAGKDVHIINMDYHESVTDEKYICLSYE